MPRHDLKKLQSRLHWIEDYASGLSSTQIVAKYMSDGATERKFRTARQAALGVGLLRQDEDVIGSGFKIDQDIMDRLNSSKINSFCKFKAANCFLSKPMNKCDLFRDFGLAIYPKK